MVLVLFFSSVLLLISSLVLKVQKTREMQLALATKGWCPLDLGPANDDYEISGRSVASSPEIEKDATAMERPGPATQSLLGEDEPTLFDSLRRAMAGIGCTVLTEVSFKDLACCGELSAAARTQFTKLLKKSGEKDVEFLICQGSSLDVVAAVRNLPRPGIRPLREHRIRQIDRILEAAGIPFIYIPHADSYDEEEIFKLVWPHLG